MLNCIMCKFYNTLCNFQGREGAVSLYPVEASFYPQSREDGGASCGRVLRHRENPPEHSQNHSYSTGMDTYRLFYLICLILTFWSVKDANIRLFSVACPGVSYSVTYSKVTEAVALITFTS